MKKFLITGTAGFIGFHMARHLLEQGHQIIGLDGMTDYYDLALKEARLQELAPFENFTEARFMLEDQAQLMELMEAEQPQYIIHLAAQAGVRYSIEAPESYTSSNLIGGFNILEAARKFEIKHLLFASTSSVYGANEKMPFSENDPVRHQMSYYAATKRANEAMAQSYAHLYQIPTTMFRFFTVYGPWGRPDMALFKFTKAMLEGQPIEVFNQGQLSRDFTYIDDIVTSIAKLVETPPLEAVKGDSKSPIAPFRVINIGNSKPIELLDFIKTLENVLNITAKKEMMPMQKGDVYRTWADTSLLKTLTGFEANTSLETGVQAFVDWYLQYYQSNETPKK